MKVDRKIDNILVTGGAGFIGSAFIRHLLLNKKFGGKCVNLDALTYAGNPENLEPVKNDPRYVFVHGNIQNESLVEHLCQEYNINAIIHFAAESHVDRSILGPQAFFETNIMGTFHLLEVVKRNPHIHFHHVSTDEVYGSLGETGYFTEESPYQPNSPYSASKASSDHLVRAYSHTYPISTCISNCSNNYGPYHFPEKLIPLMVINCLNKKPLPVYGKGLNVRDWLYVDDHAEALYMLLHHGKKGETYNIGGESERTNIQLIHDLIEIISEIQKADKKELENLITYVQDRPGHDLRYAIDCSKIKREIGWKPSHTLEEALRKTVMWYINNSSWIQGVQSGAYRKWMEENYANR